MLAYFNGSWVENKITLPLNDRALQFGDGAFETMIYQNGRINYLNDHLIRLTEALLALNLELLTFSSTELQRLVMELLQKNNIHETAKIKIIVWRKSQKQKAYGSTEREINQLIVATRCNPIDLRILTRIDYSLAIRNFESKISSFKAISSLSYVVAADECSQRKLEELIILDTENHLSECISSNLFWIKDDKIFTPALSTGCINGILRRQIIKWGNKINSSVVEVAEKAKILKNADHVFSLNVAGINLFDSIGSQTYSTKGEILDLIIQKVLDPLEV